MKYKLGSIGYAEAASLACISVCTNGLFSLDPESAFSFGNTTYLSVPLSCALSLAAFLCISESMRKCRIGTLFGLFERSFGAFFGAAASLILCACLLFCAAVPLKSFALVMRELVYTDADVGTIFFFMMPVVFTLAWMGFETLGRTAKCYSIPLTLSLAVLIIISLPRQQSYRLYPVIDGSITDFMKFSFSECVYAFTPLSALLICGKGMKGERTVKISGAMAAGIAGVICFAVLFMLARIYTADALCKLFMPLCRVNYLNAERNYALGADKLLVMLWVNGCFITAAFCIYSASLLLAQTFGQRDITPAAAFLSSTVCGIVLYSVKREDETWNALADIFIKYGAAAAVLPQLAAALIAWIRRKGIDKENDSSYIGRADADFRDGLPRSL